MAAKSEAGVAPITDADCSEPCTLICTLRLVGAAGHHAQAAPSKEPATRSGSPALDPL